MSVSGAFNEITGLAQAAFGRLFVALSQIEIEIESESQSQLV